MSTVVRIPAPSDDRPPLAALVMIAAACAALGIGAARWGTYDRHVSEEGGESGQGAAGAAPDTEATEPDVEAATAAPTEPAIEAAEPAIEAPAEPAIEPAIAAQPEAAIEAPIAAAPATGPAPASGLEVVRGRVAYLRCEGVPQRAGPLPCPRDEALEAQVWTAIDAIVGCSALPAAAGEADLVVDLAPGAIPELRARDTFARDVVRLDGTRVVACLGSALAPVEQHLGASRLLVSFRFALRAP